MTPCLTQPPLRFLGPIRSYVCNDLYLHNFWEKETALGSCYCEAIYHSRVAPCYLPNKEIPVAGIEAILVMPPEFLNRYQGDCNTISVRSSELNRLRPRSLVTAPILLEFSQQPKKYIASLCQRKLLSRANSWSPTEW